MLTEINSENFELNQLTLFLFYKLTERNMDASRYGVQKTLFKLKMELGKEHLLYSSIPYYWYIHGPYSETLANGVQSLINTPDLLEKNKAQYKVSQKYYDLFAKNPEKSFPLVFDFYPEVEEIFNSLISSRNRFYNLDKEIYQDYAPYPFMYPYKFKIFNEMESNEYYDSYFDDVIPIFFECESKLPYSEFFARYEDVYSNFIGIVDRLYTKNIIGEYFNLIKSNSLKVWNTFAPGLSFKKHEPYYEYKKKKWKMEFKEETRKLDNSMKYLHKLSRNPNSEKNQESKPQKFLSATVEAYLQG